MGCGGSTPEPVEEVKQAAEYQNADQLQNQEFDDIRSDLDRAEAAAVEAGPERNTFIGSVLQARAGHETDASIMGECCTKLQAHNRKLKSFIATADAQAVNEAMNGAPRAQPLASRSAEGRPPHCAHAPHAPARAAQRALPWRLVATTPPPHACASTRPPPPTPSPERARVYVRVTSGGFLGLGCNDKKLMAALCSRTKSQLSMTRKRYRDMYDKDMKDEVKGETGGYYGKMMS